MNAKATRKVLNEAFKRFQQLPDWPLRPAADRETSLLNDEGPAIDRVILAPIALAAGTSAMAARVLAE